MGGASLVPPALESRSTQRRRDFHVSTQSPLLAGTNSTTGNDSAGLTGATSDQVVAAALATADGLLKKAPVAA